MSAENILAAAQRIAAKLETLPEINEAFPYAKPVSAIQLGDLVMGLSGTSPPGTHGAHAYQTCVWTCMVKLGSGLVDVDGGQELQNTLASLSSAAPGEGIIGILRASPDLDAFGSPRVTEEGVEITYDEEADDNILTFLTCEISANVRIQ